MSNFYKIEGENEFAYFRANFNQIFQIFQSDSTWVRKFVELNDDFYGKVVRFDFFSILAGTNIVEQNDTHFVVRGGQYFFYRIEAIDANTSRVIPEGRLWGYWKYVVPIVLFLWCVFPVFLTPLIYKLKQKQAMNMSKLYLNSLCRYLELQGQNLYGQRPQGEIKQ